MSVEATIWAWKLTKHDVTSNEKLILLSMADRANEAFECWPSKVRLQSDTLISLKTIFKLIASLVHKGFIEDTGKREGNLNRVVVYRLLGISGRENCTIPNRSNKGTINRSKMTSINRSKTTLLNLSVEPIIEPISILSVSTNPDVSDQVPPINPKPSKPRSPKDYQQDPRFMSFYSVFPRKENPDDARKAFNQVVTDDAILQRVINDVRLRVKSSIIWQERQYIPMPATYLRKGTWKGEVITDTKTQESCTGALVVEDGIVYYTEKGN